MSTSGKRRGGRPNKGERHKRTFRFPIGVDTALQKAAAAEGQTVQDYVEGLVEEQVAPYMDDDEEHLLTA